VSRPALGDAIATFDQWVRQEASHVAVCISTAPASEDLKRLLSLPNFLERTFGVQQFAIWTITDNPTRGGYVGLGCFGVGSGPSDEEMQGIGALFEQAGIPTDRYQALH
jgi:hypothetical protein